MSLVAAACGSVFLFASLYYFARIGILIDWFLVLVGRTVYRINQPRLTEDELISISQRTSIQLLLRLGVLIAALSCLIAISALPMLLVDLSKYSFSALIGAFGISSGLALFGYYFFGIHQQKSDYSPAKQTFYHVTLGAPIVGKTIHRAESYFSSPSESLDEAIYVTGLARAGTTALLRYLSQHPELWSFTYRNLPLLMSSRIWPAINRASIKREERSHQDGIMIDLDSPEAFDEYFWRVILQERYYDSDDLIKHELTRSELEKFEALVTPHLPSNRLYLSKNNNFLLRAESYLSMRPQTTLVIVYRDFLEHAHSLLRQQKIQTEAQTDLPFTLDFMDMLGHHEFGLHRRDFQFNQVQFQIHDKNTVDYWIERWIDYYETALNLKSNRLIFVSNDKLRETPQLAVDHIADCAGLSKHSISIDASLPGQKRTYPDVPIDPVLKERAESVLQSLTELG